MRNIKLRRKNGYVCCESCYLKDDESGVHKP